MAELNDIKGVGPATAAQLVAHGLTTVKKLAKADLDRITAVRGFGPIRAAAVLAEARAARKSAKAKQGKGAKGKAKMGKSAKAKQSASKAKKKAKKH